MSVLMVLIYYYAFLLFGTGKPFVWYWQTIRLILANDSFGTGKYPERLL